MNTEESPDTHATPIQHVEEVRQVRLPPFWYKNPIIWFAQVEAQFETYKIRADTSKYYTVISALDSAVLQEVSDIIATPPVKDKYDTLKKQIILRFSDSEDRQLRKVLTEIELGDKTPSQLLREMKLLAGTRFDEKVLKTLWLQRMPASVQAILTVSDTLEIR
ncbi:hypothetical protein RN001_008997 [Aquatica leii]|uniref:DUF7041 domain-containing protein n=1 Tax=Aquatica leii TaxID=1421715 RepID=A0AAN7PI03_9COLE|nr:hypothetical protein RN001_008997 [Aquatica leii]